MTWIIENLGNIVVGIILLLIFGGAIYSTLKGRKNGGCNCSSGCSSCRACCNSSSRHSEHL